MTRSSNVLEMNDLQTANDRFKARNARYSWMIAAVAAVIIHVAVLLGLPAFEVQGASSRMVVWVGPWHPPANSDEQSLTGFVPFDTATSFPELANRSYINYRLPRTYPWPLWHYKEPSSALIEVAVTRHGKVGYAKILDGSDNGGDAALLELVQHMRFELSALPANSRGILAAVEVTIAER